MHYMMHYLTWGFFILYMLERYGGANCLTFIYEIPLVPDFRVTEVTEPTHQLFMYVWE